MGTNTVFDKTIVEEKALDIRINSLRMIHAAKSGHPGGSFSSADIMSTLYFGGHLKHDPKNPEWADRDVLVVSKGHSSPGVYSTLGYAGFFPVEETLTFRQLGSPFQGHIDRMRVPGVEMSTGSLGHGLCNALGMAMAAKLDKHEKTVYCIISDGEVQEGSTWEALMACAHYKMNNMICFLDRNRIQLDGWTEDTMALDPLLDKLKAFNWEVVEINGHDVDQINDAIKKAKDLRAKNGHDGKPFMVLANTVKGKGVSFMEDDVGWHGKAPNDELFEKALGELEAKKK